ncbi:hypothetical protein [Paenibacillus elgii]|uniref:hypothetical protein n=1 Tax=Paenibacillus elgii TaxID=189691 RepID=UPI002041377F|nr:hypothetical protein [Paenibacillus elgii]MCM3273052.1 hypothetical protein [Paenibacillus elgii]
MRISILYGVIVKFADGGMRIGGTFSDEENAIVKANELINEIKKKEIRNIKVYISQLEYDIDRNCIVTKNIIDEYSELLYPIA